MKQALIEAGKAAERGEVPVGAVVVCKERIIARAHNLTETLNDVTAHAEMQAITAAANVLGGKYLNECTLYVTVEPCVRLWARAIIRSLQTTTAPTGTSPRSAALPASIKACFYRSKSNFAEDMRKRSKKCLKMHVECTKRERRMSILLSDEEQLIVDRYLEKYKITNKSRWLRETILMFIHKNMEEDYPTLFGEHDMRR